MPTISARYDFWLFEYYSIIEGSRAVKVLISFSVIVLMIYFWSWLKKKKLPLEPPMFEVSPLDVILFDLNICSRLLDGAREWISSESEMPAKP